MKKKYFWIVYFLFDFLTAIVSWFLFNYFRKIYIEKYHFEITFKLIVTSFSITVFWLTLYGIYGNYKKVYKKYRIREISQTISQSFTGCIFIFFILLLDDKINTYQDYYRLFIVLLATHTTLTLFPRIVLTSNIVKKIHQKKIGFNTLIIGSSQKAKDTFLEITNLKKGTGHFFVGYVSTNDAKDQLFQSGLKNHGNYSGISKIIKEYSVEQVVIATEPSEHQKINSIINDLANFNVEIKVIADMYNILTGSVKMNSIFGALLITVSPEIMPSWQKILKRIMDVSISGFAIIILSPIFLILSILIKMDSRGTILFQQERIGIHNSRFKILKFRSMYIDSEKNGPQLSSENDTRITRIGRFMRKTRLDETPQFYNVIKGEMSLVGPRPERQFFIDQIISKAPHYKHISKVKPGITSWGQVKYGYAENVDEMIARLKFDLLYVENMSLTLDIKILFYTIIIILKGSGK